MEPRLQDTQARPLARAGRPIAACVLFTLVSMRGAPEPQGAGAQPGPRGTETRGASETPVLPGGMVSYATRGGIR